MKAYKLFILLLIAFSNLNANSFESVYHIGGFKIFYTVFGKNKLPTHKQVDNNHNGTPDYIEFIGKQLYKSYKLFDSLNYINPLENKRYKDKAYFITVSIVAMKNNGTAFDGINKAKKNNKEKAQPSLAMKISNKLSLSSFTPLHEYFHLIQNGYTMFKNRWYTEGTARWSESMLRAGIGKNKPLPKSKNELKNMLSQSYATSLMWNRLTYLIDNNHCRKYVLGKHRICGTSFIKLFLENLNRYDKIMSKAMNYKPYKWKESNQKASKNNKYILMALADSIVTSKTNNKEVKSFLNLLNNYVKH